MTVPRARAGECVGGPSADLILFVAISLWSLNNVVIKFGVGEISPLAFPVLRFGIGGLALLVLLRAREGTLGVALRDVPSWC